MADTYKHSDGENGFACDVGDACLPLDYVGELSLAST